MLVLLTAAAIIFVSAIRAFSFGIWQFKNKNILGGIMVMLAALTSCVLGVMIF